MSSKYDSIKTAADLVAEVQLNGLSTDQEDICRAQDIFGNTSIGELARLANDIGMNNADGEPDPKGTWSSGRKATRGTFYMIVSHIWNWEEVTRFWNLYTNPQTEELKELRKEHKKLSGLYDDLLARRDEQIENVREILFRGKCLDSNAWDESPCPLGTISVGVIRHDFDPTTIGQYIGLTDKNGVKIFEGDILKVAWSERIVVYYDDCYLAFRARNKSGVEKDLSYYGYDRLEVIGNVHDDPDLLEV